MLDQEYLKQVMKEVYEKGQMENLTFYEMMDELVEMLKPFMTERNDGSFSYPI